MGAAEIAITRWQAVVVPSRSSLGFGTLVAKLMPPFSLRRKVMAGGFLFRRMPKPSSSCSISFLCVMGFRQSSTMKMRLHVRAVLMTCTQVGGHDPRRQCRRRVYIQVQYTTMVEAAATPHCISDDQNTISLMRQRTFAHASISMWFSSRHIAVHGHLPASAFAVLRALDDARQVEQLYSCSTIPDNACRVQQL